MISIQPRNSSANRQKRNPVLHGYTSNFKSGISNVSDWDWLEKPTCPLPGDFVKNCFATPRFGVK
jgi:hypothetical protein